MEDVHGNRITRISPCIWQMIKIFNQHFRKVIGVHVLILNVFQALISNYLCG